MTMYKDRTDWTLVAYKTWKEKEMYVNNNWMHNEKDTYDRLKEGVERSRKEEDYKEEEQQQQLTSDHSLNRNIYEWMIKEQRKTKSLTNLPHPSLL